MQEGDWQPEDRAREVRREDEEQPGRDGGVLQRVPDCQGGQRGDGGPHPEGVPPFQALNLLPVAPVHLGFALELQMFMHICMH